MLFGAEDGGGGGHELGRLGIAGVHRRYRQPPEEVGRVGAEDVLVDVGLFDDDVPEPGQEFPHRLAVGPAGHPGVAHVGGHDHHPGPADDGIPLINPTSPLIFPTVSRGSPTSSQASSQRRSWSLASALVG